MNLWVEALLFFAPAGLANTAPIIANKIPLVNRWKTPMDFGVTYKGARLLGDNKSLRGLASGALLSLFIGIVAYGLGDFSYSQGTFVAGSILMGIGALLGDAIESFVKRRVGIKPGDSWFPFDQIDYIIGGLALSYPVLSPSVELMARVFVLYFGLHIIFSYIGYLAGLKEKPI